MSQDPPFIFHTKPLLVLALYERATGIPADMVQDKGGLRTWATLLKAIADVGGWSALGGFETELTGDMNDPAYARQSARIQRMLDDKAHLEELKRQSPAEQDKEFGEYLAAVGIKAQVARQGGSDIRQFGEQLAMLRKCLDAPEEFVHAQRP